MVLCMNRREGFGPHSDLAPSLPTSCFLDVVVIPLATWIYLGLLLLIIVPLSVATLLSSRSAVPKSAFFNPHASDPLPGSRTTPRWARILVRVLYTFFIIAAIAMVSLEIARLETAELGIGLLPFQYVGIVIAALVHLGLVLQRKKRREGRSKGRGRAGLLVEKLEWVFGAVFWAMLAVVWALKVAAYVMQGVHGRDGLVPQGNYGIEDEVTDVGVMIFVAVVLMIFEILGTVGIA